MWWLSGGINFHHLVFKKVLDKIHKPCYNKGTKEMEVLTMMTNNYFDTLHWNFIGTLSEAGITVDEYIDDSRTYLKQVWNDGFVEVHEIGA